MQLPFRTLSIITSSLCLCWRWQGLFSELLLAIWSIKYSSAVGFFAGRSAVLFAAFYLVRTIHPNE
ncbi:hypothetical protein ACXR0M_06065 [Pseudomonas sp. Eth.TT006]